MSSIFGQILRISGGPPISTAQRIKVGKDEMIRAFLEGVENYLPVLGEAPLQEEGGTSEVSYKNLCVLVDRLGLPTKVERHANGNVLVYWPGQTPEQDKYYLATGFDCGYFGTGPYYFARFGEKAGFGDSDDLYMALCDMPRTNTGTIWERK